MIDLIEKYTTTTSNGVLSKGIYKIDNKLYYVKGNSVSANKIGYEPFSEVMASEIASLLNITHIPYKLAPAKQFPEIHTYKCDYVSVCPMLQIPVGSSLVHLGDYLRANYPIQNMWLRTTRDILGTQFFYRMLLFDAFIGNEDRHLNNIDVIISAKGVLPAPLFDNGGSLLAWRSSTVINKKSLYLDVNDSQPFARTHNKQVMLVDEACFTPFDLQEFYAQILVKIEPTLCLLSVARARAIRNYLSDRLKYLEWGFM